MHPASLDITLEPATISRLPNQSRAEVCIVWAAVDEPLSPADVKQAVLKILEGAHQIAFSKHAMESMAARSITKMDVANVLRGGTATAGELEHGSWRYRLATSRFTV